MILFQERESWGIYFQSRYALQYQQWTAISLLISVWLGRFWKHIMLSGGSLWRLSWNQLTSCLNFGIFNWPKKNLNLTQFIQGFQCKKNLHKLLFIWPSFLKAITEDNPRCWRQSPWSGSALAQLGLVGQASTNRQCFQHKFPVGCSGCWPQRAPLRKRCYHSCYPDLVLVSKRVNLL